MTGQVDYYVLDSTAPQDRWRYACRLTEKAHFRGMHAAILAAGADAVRALPLLWPFADHSFVSQKFCAAEPDADFTTSVRLMGALPAGDALAADVLVNWSGQMRGKPARFARILEIQDAHPRRRRVGPDRFKAHRDLKVALKTHEVSASADA